jgi:hypothetical protein
MRLRATLVLIFTTLLPAAILADETQKPVNDAEAIRAAIKTQLPSPPAGFEWQLYKNAVFLKPVKWNEGEKNSSSGGIPITVYAASPEKFSESKQFEMGVTVQIISGSKRIRGIEANKMALLYLKPFLDAHKKEDVLILDQNKKGEFERTFFRYRDAPPGLKPIIVHKFILANNSADSVHVFTFESPADSWEDNWSKYGTPILSKLSVLPNVPAN